MYLKQFFSAPRVLIRFQLCELHIVNQYNVNKTCLLGNYFNQLGLVLNY